VHYVHACQKNYCILVVATAPTQNVPVQVRSWNQFL